jgi:hypothetical protein
LKEIRHSAGRAHGHDPGWARRCVAEHGLRGNFISGSMNRQPIDNLWRNPEGE